MADVRRIVDEIRFYLDSSEAEMTDAIREAAREYADACRQANQRLRRCGEFLKKELRSEAIQLAEAEPDLLELVATLDFPERKDWEQIVSLYNLPIGEPVLVDTAEALNEAYALQEPLKKLLDKHRFLALIRAPLSQRLAVLRKLAAVDGESDIWEEDVREMERARLREIEGEAVDAANRIDSTQLWAISEELEKAEWKVSIPLGIRKTVANLNKTAAVADAKHKLEELAATLEIAYTTSNVERGRELKQRWDRLQEVANLHRSDPVVQRAAPVLQWLAGLDIKEAAQQKREQAFAALQAALDEGSVTKDELEALNRAALRASPSIPEPLGTRYRMRIAAMTRQERFRRNLIVGLAAFAIIGVAVFAGVLLRRSMRIADADRVAQSASQMIAEGEIAQARELVDGNPDLYASDQWLAMLEKLAEAEKKDSTRRNEYNDLIAAIPRITVYEEARDKLNRATLLAANDEQKAAVARLDTELEDRHRKEMTARQKGLSERIEAITKDVDRADELAESDKSAGELETLLAGIRQQIGQLQTAVGGADAAFDSQMRLLQTRLTGIKDRREQTALKKSLYDKIKSQAAVNPVENDSPKKLASYLDSLGQFARNYPGDPRTIDFHDVMDEALLYQAILDWQRLIVRWKTLLPDDPAEVQRRLAECDEFVKSHKSCPIHSAVERYGRYLAAVARRNEGAGGNKSEGLNSKLKELFSGPLMKDVHVLWDKEGAAYYLSAPVNFSAETVANFRYMNGFRGESHGKTIERSALKSPVSVEAPQSVLAETVQRDLTNLGPSSWESCLKNVCQHVRAPQDMDPFLQYALLRYTLEYASAGSAFLQPGLAKAIEILRDPQMDLSTRWMEPKSDSASKARERAAALLGRVPDLDAAWQQAETARKELAQELFVRCQFVGVLERTGDAWRCVSNWKPDASYDLVVIVPGSDKTSPHWEKIGTVKDGHLEIEEHGRTPVLREGRLVLAWRAPGMNNIARASGPSLPGTGR